MVREDGTLVERLEKCRSMIGKMCKERRGPKMTIPLQWDDEDFYICRTIEDAISALLYPSQTSGECECTEWGMCEKHYNEELDKVLSESDGGHYDDEIDPIYRPEIGGGDSQ